MSTVEAVDAPVPLVELINGKFSYFDTRRVDKHNHSMLNPFRRLDEVVGDIQVPQWNVTDFASINTLRDLGLFIIFALLAGYGDQSATIHDYLYGGGLPVSGQVIYRKDADDIYYRALRAEGVARWRAGIFYAGVRLFGASRWKGAVQ
jgi:hypothetical protein